MVLLRSGWEFELPLFAEEYSSSAERVIEDPCAQFNNARFDIFSSFTTAMKWLAQGKIPLQGVVRTLSPENPNEIYHALKGEEFDELFIVLDWTKF